MLQGWWEVNILMVEDWFIVGTSHSLQWNNMKKNTVYRSADLYRLPASIFSMILRSLALASRDSNAVKTTCMALFMRTLQHPPSQAMRAAGMKLRSQHIVSRMMASAWNIAPTYMSWISSSRRCVVDVSNLELPNMISWYQLIPLHGIRPWCILINVLASRYVSGEFWEKVMPNDQRWVTVSFYFGADGQMGKSTHFVGFSHFAVFFCTFIHVDFETW